MSAARTGQRDAASAPPAAAAAASAGWPARAVRFLPIGFVAAVMAVLGVWGLGRRGAMGNDEIVTRYASTLSLGQLAHLLEHTDIYHGFYYVVMHPWVAVFGTTPSAIRVPSVIAMTVAAGLMVHVVQIGRASCRERV